MTFMNNPIAGIFGAVLATVFWGSNYVGVKKFRTFDGMMFQWFLCTGIFITGILITLCNFWANGSHAEDFTFISSGLIGGALWAIGNAIVIPIIKSLGYGLGFGIWTGTSLVWAYLGSRLGLFGLEKPTSDMVWLHDIGIFLCTVAVVTYTQVTPESKVQGQSRRNTRAQTGDAHDDAANARLLDNDHEGETPATLSPVIVPIAGHPGPDSPIHTISPKPEDANFVAHLPRPPSSFMIPPMADPSAKPPSKPLTKVWGILLAVLAGICFGSSCEPMSLWQQVDRDHRSGIRFLLSHVVGIFIMSNIFFIGYSYVRPIRKKNTREPLKLNVLFIRPAFYSGVMWCLAQAGNFVAIAALGFSVGMPITQMCPLLFGSLVWSMLVFREVTTKRNLIFISIALFLMAVGVSLVAVP